MFVCTKWRDVLIRISLEVCNSCFLSCVSQLRKKTFLGAVSTLFVVVAFHGKIDFGRIFFRASMFDAFIVLCKQIYSSVSCVAKKRVSRWCTTHMFRQFQARCTIFPNWLWNSSHARIFWDHSFWLTRGMWNKSIPCVAFCFRLNHKWKQSPTLRFQLVQVVSIIFGKVPAC